jgi:hypothetical protein
VIELCVATTAEEREAVFRFWYSVYVEEMGRFQSHADHEHRSLKDPEDDRSMIFYARDADAIVASCRLSWGGDGFSERQIEQYCLEALLRDLPAESLAVGERTMVAPAYRGGSLYHELGLTTGPPLIERGVKMTFGACEPHLVSFYSAMGQRPYAERNFFSEESGYLIPNVSFVQGPDVFGDDPPPSVQQVLHGDRAVRGAVLDGEDEYWKLLWAHLVTVPPERSVFRDLTEDEVNLCTARSTLIRCRAGDQLLRRGGTARNPFVVASGRVQASVDGQPVCEAGPGELIGESGLLGDANRGADVYVTEDDTHVVALSERSLRILRQSRPDVALKLLSNVSTGLWGRLRDARLLTG